MEEPVHADQGGTTTDIRCETSFLILNMGEYSVALFDRCPGRGGHPLGMRCRCQPGREDPHDPRRQGQDSNVVEVSPTILQPTTYLPHHYCFSSAPFVSFVCVNPAVFRELGTTPDKQLLFPKNQETYC